MGTAVSCDRCPTAATSSVINLSDALILRMVDGVEVPKTEETVSAEDSDWFDKLKCLDDAHSTAYGLTVKQLDKLMKRVELNIKERNLINYCPSDVVEGCYKFNSKCTLQCKKEVQEYIDCIDAKRLHKLKVLMEEARRRQLKAETEAKLKKGKK